MATKKAKAVKEGKVTPVEMRATKMATMAVLKKQPTNLADLAKALHCTPREARRAARRAVKDKALKWTKVGSVYYVAHPSCKTAPPETGGSRKAKNAKTKKAAKAKKAVKKAKATKKESKPKSPRASKKAKETPAKKPTVKSKSAPSGNSTQASGPTADPAAAPAVANLLS